MKPELLPLIDNLEQHLVATCESPRCATMIAMTFAVIKRLYSMKSDEEAMLIIESCPTGAPEYPNYNVWDPGLSEDYWRYRDQFYTKFRKEKK